MVKVWLSVGDQIELIICCADLAAARDRQAMIALIQPVIHPDHRQLYADLGLSGPRLLPPVTGGAERQASVRAGLDALLASRGVAPVTFRDWRRIEAAEVAAAIDGNPREKFTSVEAMLAAIGR